MLAAPSSAILQGMRLAPPFRAFVAPGPLIGAIALFAVFSAARADELKLKDGSVVVGTIVGFEEHSFKVKTNYGFAEVQKDQVLSIVISPVAKKKDAEKTGSDQQKDPSRIKLAVPDRLDERRFLFRRGFKGIPDRLQSSKESLFDFSLA